ncbi:MAG: AbrB/MazE/SpoVT family DNA-binding domain-containing protein [Candidatus Rickettsia vulgarisii]
MAHIMKVSSKGQVIIPVDIRSKFGFLPNTEIAFIEKIDGVLIKKYRNNKKKGKKLLDNMSGKGGVKISTDEIMKLIRDGY